MHFGLYLVKHGMITGNQFIESLEAQLASRPQLGALAIETGKLSVKQVFSVLRIQADKPQELFGQISVEEGFLSESDLSSLLYQQLVEVTPMSQIVQEKGLGTAEDIEEHLVEYHAACRAQCPNNLVAGLAGALD